MLTTEAKALALRVMHTDWTEARIARAAGCSRQHLYELPAYMAAVAAMKKTKSEYPKGTKYRQQIEASDED